MLIPVGPTLMLFRSDVIREPAGELLGTMMLTLLGNGANCQAILSTNPGVASSPKGDYLSLAFGWACGSSTPRFYLARALIRTWTQVFPWVPGSLASLAAT